MTAVTGTRAKLILNGACLGAAILLWPSTAESPVSAAPPIEPAGVTVEHQLIRVGAAAHAPRAKPRPVRAGTRLAFTKPSQPVVAKSLGARAGRLLLGDGRHRPEPFPRPGR
jgi:hypothetical protein